MRSLSFEGERILVTGGTRSFGEGFAREFLRLGGEVTVTGTRPDGNVIDAAGYRAVDFTDASAVAAFSAWAQEAGFDVLVNNAGINVFAPYDQLDPEVFLKVQQVNLHAPMRLCRAVLPHMKRRGWGRIVNIRSILGKVGRAQNASYTASKFGLDGLTISLAVDVAPHGILANCVAPGFFLTDMTRKLHDEADRARLAASIPMGRLGEIPELVRFVTWLASEENTYIPCRL